MTRHARYAALAALALVMAGCVVSVAPTSAPPAGRPAVAAVNPIIQAIAANPTAIVEKGATITFTVVTHSPTGEPLDYTWSATKGQLSATKGQMVSWAPLKINGTVDAGSATVQVVVTSPSGGVAQASVNLTIAPDGSAKADPAPAASTPPASSAPTPTQPPASPDARNGANLVLDGYTLRHHWNNQLDGYDDNGDDVIQRGETVFLDPKIKNVGTAATGDVVATLELNDPYVSATFLPTDKEGRAASGPFYTWIAPGELKAPNEQMPSGASRSNDAEGLKITVSRDCPSGHVAKGILRLEDRFGNTWTPALELTLP